MSKEAQELKRIRKRFKASRRQFGEVFLGKSQSSIKMYETDKVKAPESVLMLAYAWEGFLNTLKGKKNGN